METGEVHDRVAAPVTSAVAEHNYAAAVAAHIIAHNQWLKQGLP